MPIGAKGKRSSSTNSARLAVSYVPLAEIKPNANNPRKHSNRQIHQVAESIRVHGFVVPMLVDEKMQLIAGHGRLLAAKTLGLQEAPVIRLAHLTPEQVRVLAIADNRLVETSKWDDQLLAEQLKHLSEVELDFSLELTGFEMGEIDLRIEGLSSDGNQEDDPADQLPDDTKLPPITKPGDLWLLDKHRLYCGNSLHEDSLRVVMEGRKADMVFIDPPYNLKIGDIVGLGKTKHREFAMASGEMSSREFTDFLARSFKNLARFSKDGSIHFVCMDWRHLGEIHDAGSEGYSELKNVCVWVKTNAGMGSFYRSQHEFIFTYKAGNGPHRNNFQLGQYGRNRTNVWQYAGSNTFSKHDDRTLHPTVKPVALVADCILDCSARRDVVLDTFMGSGTTLLAAEKTGRVCSGIEIDPRYVDVAIRRWQAFTGSTATHAASGQSFSVLEGGAAND